MAARPAPVDGGASLYRCSIIENRSLGSYGLVSFASREIAASAQPGQFLMVRESGDRLDPLLPRPLGIHAVDGDLVRMLIEPKGKGTKAICSLSVGDSLDVLGPLGRGFDISGDDAALLIGGGVGIAPLKYLASELTARGRYLSCVLGFRGRAQALAVESFSSFECDVWTEDGSLGKRGLASAALADFVGNGGLTKEIFACGPGPMLREISRLLDAGNHTVRAQFSLDSHMACGIGSCQGCVVEAAGGYRKVCTEGPVFDATELKW